MSDFTISDVARMQQPDQTIDDVQQQRVEPKVGTRAPPKIGGTGGGLSSAGVTAAIGKAPVSPPTMWDSAKEGAGNFVYGAAKGFADPVYGVSQLALHGANTVSNGALQGTTNSFDTFLTQMEQQYQADTQGSIAAGAGRLGANLLTPIKGATLMRGTAALPRLVNAASTGAAIGASQPVIGAGDTSLGNVVSGNKPANYWQDKALQIGVGAGVGGGLSAAGTVAGSLYNSVRPLVAPQSAAGDILLKGLQKTGADAQASGDLQSLAGSDPQALIARLRAATSLVPGSMPTTAQVANLPQLVMAEKVLKNNPNYRTAFEERAIANNKARLDALQGVAGTPEGLQSAIDARRTLTEPLYSASNSTVHSVDDSLQAILDRPSARAALSRGQKLAAERGEAAGPVGGTPATPSPVLNANGQPFPGQPAVPASVDGRTLQYLKMGIDDLQKEGKLTGMGTHEANALGSTRNDLDSWLVSNSPAFKDANSLYAAKSVPVNTMEAGQQLYGDLSNGALNAGGDIAPTLAQYRSRYAAALKSSPYGIDPNGQSTLDAIQADLQRETISNSIKSSGSDTYFNSQAPNWLSAKLFGENLDGKSNFSRLAGAAFGAISPEPISGAGLGFMGAQKLGAFAGNRVNTQLQNAMLDPNLFAQMLSDAARRSGQKGLLDTGAPNVSGAVDGALSLLSGS